MLKPAPSLHDNHQGRIQAAPRHIIVSSSLEGIMRRIMVTAALLALLESMPLEAQEKKVDEAVAPGPVTNALPPVLGVEPMTPVTDSTAEMAVPYEAPPWYTVWGLAG